MERKQGRRNIRGKKTHKRKTKLREVSLQKTTTKGKHRKMKGEESKKVIKKKRRRE